MKKKIYLLSILSFLSCISTEAQTYHENDKEGLRQFIGQSSNNLRIAGLSVSDTVSWRDSESWLTKLKNINLTWNNSRITSLDITQKGYIGNLDCSKFEKLQTLTCGANSLVSIDLSKNLEISYLKCYQNKLNSLDVTKNPKLYFFECYDNKITSLDVTKNLELGWFVCQYNELTSLDVTKNLKLYHFDCAYMPLGSIDVTNNTELNWFNCSDNKLTSLDLSKNVKIDYVFCHENNLKIIDLSNNKVIRKLFAQNNELRFSTLPKRKLTYYKFASQATIDGGEVNYLDIIDLSSEYQIENIKTDFRWYDGDRLITSVTDLGNGKFIPNKENIGKTLTCKMTNAYFPGDNYPSFQQLVLEYKVKIVEANQYLKESLLFHKSTGERLYRVDLNEPFNVFVSNTEASLGLYDKNSGRFITDIVLDKNGSTYTCAVPDDNIHDGEYIIQPYILSGNQKIILSRVPGSFVIDRLPLTVEFDWGIMTRSVEEEIINHMVIRTSEKDLLQINVGESFKLQLRTTSQSSNSIKIGLFNWSNGSLAAELVSTTSNNILYTCYIPSLTFLSGNYILAPYEEKDGKIQFIERPSDKEYYLDRFPLYINNPIWTRSAVSDNDTKANISIYPNPVKDLLYISSDSNSIQNVKLFDLQGRLIKSESGITTLPMNDLNKGVYILVIDTKENTATYRILKN